jgi:hypothetical protein
VHSASGAVTVLISGDVTSTKRCSSKCDRISIRMCSRLLVLRINRLTELFLVASRATRVLYPCSDLQALHSHGMHAKLTSAHSN